MFATIELSSCESCAAWIPCLKENLMPWNPNDEASRTTVGGSLPFVVGRKFGLCLEGSSGLIKFGAKFGAE